MSQDNADDTASIMSDTATLVDRTEPREPDVATMQKSSHSTRASRLFYETSQGKYSHLEYMELTFSVMVMCNNLRGPLVVAVNETFPSLLDDIRRMFKSRFSSTEPKELRVSWSSGARDFGSNFTLNSGNITAMMRLMKSRNGVDMIMAK